MSGRPALSLRERETIFAAQEYFACRDNLQTQQLRNYASGMKSDRNLDALRLWRAAVPVCSYLPKLREPLEETRLR